jgi:hypothetical protein
MRNAAFGHFQLVRCRFGLGGAPDNAELLGVLADVYDELRMPDIATAFQQSALAKTGQRDLKQP